MLQSLLTHLQGQFIHSLVEQHSHFLRNLGEFFSIVSYNKEVKDFVPSNIISPFVIRLRSQSSNDVLDIILSISNDILRWQLPYLVVKIFLKFRVCFAKLNMQNVLEHQPFSIRENLHEILARSSVQTKHLDDRHLLLSCKTISSQIRIQK